MLQPENINLSASTASTPAKVFSDLRPIKAVHSALPQPTSAVGSSPALVENSAQLLPKLDAPKQPTAVSRPLTQLNPADRFHAKAEAAKPAFLDLRNMPLKTASLESVKSPPINLQTIQLQPAPVVTQEPRPVSGSAVIVSPAGRTQERLAKASSITKSDTISRFGHMLRTTAETTAPAASLPAPVANQATPIAPLASDLVAAPRPVNAPGQLIMPQTIKPEAPAAHNLPNSVVSQIEALAKAAGPASLAQSQLSTPKPSQTLLKPTFKPASAVAALAAIVLMGGYTWVNNYPKMSIKAAASKAGIEASLPSYVPSNYSLATKVDFAPGEVTLNLHNTQTGDDIAIKQRSTTWDSSSLLENFVAKDTSEYSSVQGQGLTIYLFDKNKASWVNHGIWYSIDGNAGLTRDQILKLAYSL